jgi:three-Cys-motif partner protein
VSSNNSFFDEKRTWSRIKDELLKAYLAPYLAKVSRTRRPIIVADCFAGKGKFDNGEPGSPLIIADSISHQLNDPASPEIKGVFIEKKYFKDLKANIPAYSWCYPLEGDYEERMDYFVKEYQSRDQNLFLYVDPYGIKSVLFSQFEAIQKKKGFKTVELLLNLNTFGFLREACRLLKKRPDFETESPAVYEQDVNSPDRLDEIAGGSYWRDIIDKYYSRQIKMAAAEEEFISQYCTQLRKIFRYVVNIPIKTTMSNIPKYRIVFGTDHEDGLLLMADNMNKRWSAFREEARDKQSPLFECDFPDPTKQDNWNVEKKIVSLIDKEIELKDLLVKLVQEYGINFSTSEFKQYLKQMEIDQIEVKRFPATTLTGKPSTSWDHTKTGFSIKISRRAQWQQPLL